MIILGIESSCDDTAVALVKANKDSFEILAEKTASQIDIHKKYGGVVPEIAGRCHAENINPLIEEVMNPFDSTQGKPDIIAVTSGPGLITGLMVGVEAAKTLSYLWNIPIVSVNHIEGHIHSVEIQNKRHKLQYPALALIASGGHTELIIMKKRGEYERVGATKDDAAGECFDKIAKLLGLDYPGGPKISKFAETGNPEAIKFPRPMLKENNLDFSFAGLKTSALYWLRDNTQGTYNLQLTTYSLSDFCASFEQAIIDVLVGKTLKAIETYKPKTIILGGGVAANKKLRETLIKEVENISPMSHVLCPTSGYAMDNATMIAVAGYYKALKKDFTAWNKLVADPVWKIAG